MIGNCKRCEYGNNNIDWCDLKKKKFKPNNEKCDDFIEVPYEPYGCDLEC